MKANVDSTPSLHEAGQFVPRSDYLQAIYAIARHWHSDIDFFEDELNFFRMLIDRYLMLFIDSKNVEQGRTMISHVVQLRDERASLEERIACHQQHISAMLENPYVHKPYDYRAEHAGLETEFAAFVNKYRSVKKEVFSLTERVVHSDSVRKTIDWG